MRDKIIAIAAALFLASCAGNPAQPGRGDRPVPFAKNPTVVLALDIAQSRNAQERGAWQALADTAAQNAILFTPAPVNAKEWIEGRKSASDEGAKWQPHRVYLSCDGKTGVTTGAFQQLEGTKTGFYTTVWQYLENSRGDGEWRWLLRHGAPLDEPRVEPEMLQTRSASCKGEPTASVVAPVENVQMMQGFSRDQSLSWTWQYRPDRSRYLAVNIWNGSGWEKVFADSVKAQ